MKNLLSYCGLDDPRLSASDKDLPVQRRQKLAAENYKVSRGLVKACKEEIKTNKCKKELHNENKTVRLAEILLCLEGENIESFFYFNL